MTGAIYKPGGAVRYLCPDESCACWESEAPQ